MEKLQTLDAVIFSRVDLSAQAQYKPIEQITKYDLLPSAYKKLSRSSTCYIEIEGERRLLKSGY